MKPYACPSGATGSRRVMKIRRKKRASFADRPTQKTKRRTVLSEPESAPECTLGNCNCVGCAQQRKGSVTSERHPPPGNFEKIVAATPTIASLRALCLHAGQRTDLHWPK